MLCAPYPPDGATLLFTITQNDLLEVIMSDGTQLFGYFVMYESDGRLQIRDHDQPKKDQSSRFGISKIKSLRKFKISVLGEYEALPDGLNRDLA
jgi:CRISPR-associated endonuclease Csn1